MKCVWPAGFRDCWKNSGKRKLVCGENVKFLLCWVSVSAQFLSLTTFFLLSCRAAIMDLAELTIGKLSETLNVPQCLPLHLIYFLQCSDLVLEARFYHHTSIQHYRLKISSFCLFSVSKRKKRYITQDAGLHYQWYCQIKPLILEKTSFWSTEGS